MLQHLEIYILGPTLDLDLICSFLISGLPMQHSVCTPKIIFWLRMYLKCFVKIKSVMLLIQFRSTSVSRWWPFVWRHYHAVWSRKFVIPSMIHHYNLPSPHISGKTGRSAGIPVNKSFMFASILKPSCRIFKIVSWLHGATGYTNKFKSH